MTTLIKVVDVPSDLDLDNAKSLVYELLRGTESKFILALYHFWDQADAELGEMISEEAFLIAGRFQEVEDG